jgi:hypoxanthine phosphoribosyltransferase
MELPQPDEFLSADSISAKVSELGRKITADFRGRQLTIVAITNGAVIFAADLIRQINLPMQLDMIPASSYAKTESSGTLTFRGGFKIEIKNRHVLLVDEILDTGRTMSGIKNYIKSFEPADIKICVLLDKPARRVIPVKSDYTGFSIPDRFVVGYGLDYKEHYRNLPYIGTI